MSRKARTATSTATEPASIPQTAAEARTSNATLNGENSSAYFRQLFAENPRLLGERSNAVLFDRWLEDHPGYEKVPQAVKTSLQNVKNTLRKQQQSGKPGRRPQSTPAQETRQPQRPTLRRGDLEKLEFLIDECLSTARALDAETLTDVISNLRRARNEIVLRLRHDQ